MGTVTWIKKLFKKKKDNKLNFCLENSSQFADILLTSVCLEFVSAFTFLSDHRSLFRQEDAYSPSVTECYSERTDFGYIRAVWRWNSLPVGWLSMLNNCTHSATFRLISLAYLSPALRPGALSLVSLCWCAFAGATGARWIWQCISTADLICTSPADIDLVDAEQ